MNRTTKAAKFHAREPALKVVRIPLAELVHDPDNPRTHDERNLAGIKGSLEQFGQVEPLVVRNSDNRVIGGNGRLDAMLALGWDAADCVYVNVDDAQARALSVALNRTAELGGWDPRRLAAILDEVGREGLFAPSVIGWSTKELDNLLRHSGAPQIVEDGGAPLPADTALSKRGDIWTLGAHRIMCGDSSKWEDLEKLLAGAQIHLLNTDPPYNVKVEPRSNNAIAAGLSSFAGNKKHGSGGQTHHQKLDVERFPGKANPTHKQMRAKDRPLANDFMKPEDFEAILLAWFQNAARAMAPGRCFYIWGGYANVANYPPALIASGLYFSQAVIWVKEHPVLTRKDFMGNHEWCFYGWKEGAAHEFFGPPNVPDTWSVKKVNPQSMVHLTEKPVELAVRALQYGSRAGENVLDLFAGSGSTLMACEQMDRHCYTMELDEAYCDVVLRRWRKHTGREPLLIEPGKAFASGKTMAQVALERGVPDPSHDDQAADGAPFAAHPGAPAHHPAHPGAPPVARGPGR